MTNSKSLESCKDEGYASIEDEDKIQPTAEKKFKTDSVVLADYSIFESVGRGSYAVVKLAYKTSHSTQVAIKIISKSKAPEDFLRKFLPREIQVCRIVENKNIIKFFDVSESLYKYYIIMEFAKNGDLLTQIKMKKRIDNEQSVKWANQSLSGIQYLHSKKIVHRDLKCENVLIDKDSAIKLTDFGFAKILNVIYKDDECLSKENLSSTFCGSYAYAPPEILRGIPYDPYMADMWSLGIIFFTMVFGKLPFDDSNHKNLLKQVMNPLKFPSNPRFEPSSSCKKTLSNLIQANIKTRWYIDETFESSWLKGKSKRD